MTKVSSIREQVALLTVAALVALPVNPRGPAAAPTPNAQIASAPWAPAALQAPAASNPVPTNAATGVSNAPMPGTPAA